MEMQSRLVFLIGSPRSGTTLLQRMLGSHSQVHTHPEPHLLTPLAHLGYYQTVEKAPYDHINAAEANRELVGNLPGGEADYLDALRAYADTLYGRLTEPSGKQLFLDKTPAYGLILDFLERLYPEARYVVLTRHPVGILHSFAHSFFDGDYQRAWEFNPIVARYVPAIARFLRETKAPHVHLRYEDLVADPEAGLAKIFDFLGVEHEAEAVDYGEHQHIKGSFGDPITVNKHSRPVADKAEKWAGDLAAHPENLRFVSQVVEGLDPADLETWGYPAETLLEAVQRAGATPTRLSAVNPYRLKRKVMLAVKRPVQRNTLGLGGLLRKVRYYCDVLLRA